MTINFFSDPFIKKQPPLNWLNNDGFNNYNENVSKTFYFQSHHQNIMQTNNNFKKVKHKIQLTNNYKKYVIDCINNRQIIKLLPNLYEYVNQQFVKQYVIQHFNQILQDNNIFTKNVNFDFSDYK